MAKNDITPAIDFFTHNPRAKNENFSGCFKGRCQRIILLPKCGVDPIAGLSLGEMYRYGSFPAVSIQSDMLKLYSDFTSDYSQILICGIDLEERHNNL